MYNTFRRQALTALSLVALLLFGAVAAEARDYHRRSDRVAKDALIGAAVGTLAQIVTGRTEGSQILRGAVVGGALGAVVGSSRGYDRYGRYGYSYNQPYYSQGYDSQGYYGQGYYSQPYYDQSYYYSQPYSNGYYVSDPYYDQYDRSYRDGYRNRRGCRH
jgi:hypothetical protein